MEPGWKQNKNVEFVKSRTSASVTFLGHPKDFSETEIGFGGAVSGFVCKDARVVNESHLVLDVQGITWVRRNEFP